MGSDNRYASHITVAVLSFVAGAGVMASRFLAESPSPRDFAPAHVYSVDLNEDQENDIITVDRTGTRQIFLRQADGSYLPLPEAMDQKYDSVMLGPRRNEAELIAERADAFLEGMEGKEND